MVIDDDDDERQRRLCSDSCAYESGPCWSAVYLHVAQNIKLLGSMLSTDRSPRHRKSSGCTQFKVDRAHSCASTTQLHRYHHSSSTYFPAHDPVQREQGDCQRTPSATAANLVAPSRAPGSLRNNHSHLAPTNLLCPPSPTLPHTSTPIPTPTPMPSSRASERERERGNGSTQERPPFCLLADRQH